MKRIVIYIAVLTASLLLQTRGTDVGKLQPVGVVQLYKEDETVFIVTDSGDSGQGKTVEAAFDNLEETTAGVIFLDTADYLLLSKTAVSEAKGLQRYLKPSTKVCIAEKNIDPKQAAEYLAVHRPSAQIKNKEGLANAQTLIQENGRLMLK